MEERKEEGDEASYAWGEVKTKGTYKSVNIRGEVYEVGHCVQCSLEATESFIWKILKLFQDGDAQKCRIRRLLSEPQLPPNVKGLDPPAEPKELFLASMGAGVEEDVPLGKIVRRYTILCTFQDDDQLNPIPSDDQIKQADYFFHRGYDPASEEVVALDAVVDELGAQYVYNKVSWLGDNAARRSSSQVSAARLPSQSHASGSSAHQSAGKGMYSSAPGVSPPPSRDSTERKLKKRKSDSVASKQPKVVDDAVLLEKTNEVRSPKKCKVAMSAPVTRSDHVVFALPAPAKLSQVRGQPVLPPASAKPPAPTSKPAQREGKGPSVKTSSSPSAALKQTDAKSADRKRKDGAMPSEGPVKKILKPGAPLKPQKRGEDVKSKDAVVRPVKPAIEGVKKTLKPSGIPASKPHKRAEEESVRKSQFTLNRAKNLNVEIPAAEMPPKTSRDASPRVSKSDVGRKRDDSDFVHAPSTSQRSPSVNVPAKKDTTPKDSIRSPLISPRISPRPTLDKSLSDRAIDTLFSPATSPPQQQIPHGQIFKTVVEDWGTTIPKAVQSNRVVLLGNVDPELHSEDLAEALTHTMKTKFDVRIVPPVSFSYRTTTALLKLPSSKKAEEFVNLLKSNHLLVANRVVTASQFTFDQFKGKHSLKHPGHLEFSQMRDHHVEDYKNAVATSHLAQGNTIEFAYGLPWRVLDEQREDQWRRLQEAHSIAELH